MSLKGKKPSPRTGATRKRKRDARPQTRQSSSPSQSPSKRGRDAQCDPSPAKREEVTADVTPRLIGEPTSSEEGNIPKAPVAPLSKAGLGSKVEDTKELFITDTLDSPSSMFDNSKFSGTYAVPSAKPSTFATAPPRAGAIDILNDTVKKKLAEAKKGARHSHGLVLHIPAISPSQGVHVDDSKLFVTPSPGSRGSSSPSKESEFRTPSGSPSKLVFGVGFGSGSGILSELPFYADSPGKRYDDRFAQALASPPALGSMGPPDSSPSLGSGSSHALGTPESPTGSGSALGVLRQSRSQLLDSLSARAIADAIDRRDSERDGMSLLRVGNAGRPPRAVLGTLYEKPVTHFPGAGNVFDLPSQPATSPDRQSATEVSDGGVDPTARAARPIGDLPENRERAKTSSGNVVMAGLSQDLPSYAGGGPDFYVQPGDGSPKLRPRRLVPFTRPDIGIPHLHTPKSDEEESDLELSDKENI